MDDVRPGNAGTLERDVEAETIERQHPERRERPDSARRQSAGEERPRRQNRSLPAPAMRLLLPRLFQFGAGRDAAAGPHVLHRFQ